MASRDEDLAAVEHHLALLLRRSRAFLQRSAEAVHAGLEPQAYGLLVRLDELGAVRPSELADYFAIGRPTISRQLAVLESHGLVQRMPDESDARSTLMTLTETGKERVQEIRSLRREQFRSFMAEWSDAEIRQLMESLRRLNQGTFWE